MLQGYIPANAHDNQQHSQKKKKKTTVYYHISFGYILDCQWISVIIERF